MSAQHPEKTPKHQQCFSWKNTYEMMFFYQRNMISSFHSSIEMSSRGQKFWRNTKWTQMKILLTLLQFHTEMILSGLSLANIKSSQWHSYIQKHEISMTSSGFRKKIKKCVWCAKSVPSFRQVAIERTRGMILELVEKSSTWKWRSNANPTYMGQWFIVTRKNTFTKRWKNLHAQIGSAMHYYHFKYSGRPGI